MRYWDLTEEARGRLDRLQLEPYIAVELMEKGVRPPDTFPEVPETPVMPSVRKIPVFRVGSTAIVFRDEEGFRKFLELQPLTIDTDYACGYGGKGEFIRPFDDAEGKIEQFPDKSELDRNKAEIVKFNELEKQANDAATIRRKASDEVSSALSDLFEDWEVQKSTVTAWERIRATFEEYKATCKGDETMALTFLIKTYGEENVNKAIPETMVRENNLEED